MNLPEKLSTQIITLSDRAYRGEYTDLSGPRIKERLEEYFRSEGWNYETKIDLIPDDSLILGDLVRKASEYSDFIFTTGGTGLGPRDITIETVAPMLNKEIPGVMEYIRIKYGAENPNALLSRGIAGITGRSLIYTLPGSLRAVDEYMTEILKTLRHTLLMQYGIDTHHRHQ